MTTTFGTSTNSSKKMAKVQCLSLVDLSNIGNLNTLRQTMELRTQVTITGGPKRITNQIMEEYGFGVDHGNVQTIWKLEFEYEQSEVFGSKFESLKRDLDFIPIEYELEETAILKTPCFITTDMKQRNIYFQHI